LIPVLSELLKLKDLRGEKSGKRPFIPNQFIPVAIKHDAWEKYKPQGIKTTSSDFPEAPTIKLL